ncbi:MAG: hypothetical protein A3G03_00805 [Candidatus Taylorbacteria bacterium RIFCSPLOWO2_12_FULL_44_15c]|uniref:Uncharacterized protein n=1 Tax=Candidatus Taylorbacteria bacterium RIFCSPLOWO2_12_FULL_44_15c TaxID=1802333 RepID=A0A1G2P4J5_9BACT|nr:MAG: hypothetical protein A3I97_00125 [Candidatus Taylorbacteria bacterium RIFCSPLOWO2_02_FULL_44_35]OHA43246.1 MAG: hypothetical protein A3G03_00805 [Candidatus Taylorbacteria bacterium RIFCSPLOWO2_12_FULL_44_15c]
MKEIETLLAVGPHSIGEIAHGKAPDRFAGGKLCSRCGKTILSKCNPHDVCDRCKVKMRNGVLAKLAKLPERDAGVYFYIVCFRKRKPIFHRQIGR